MMRRKYLTIASAFLILSFAMPAYAGYGAGVINRFYVSSNGWVYFGLENQLSNTCNYWSEQFRFNTSSAGGSNMLSVLISAKIAGKKVTVWYSNSSAPGSDQTSGCLGDAISTLNGIGIQ